MVRQAQRAERFERRATPWWNPAPKMKAACKVATLNSQLSLNSQLRDPVAGADP
ncbi:MAG: hypothetical protein AMXMBFR19_21290 [Chthonomonadaceae bacterium]|uniref:Uncharacterized protein n=1 Tax=Candidatus Nitrosymbiomonas proteolyticus TaxID=2608984 RepID=A0A809RIG4_9BACT|nr:hypothetical protein NPRO_18900 [Candidatus Nitrosymbiomonas proteolyticus]